MKNENNKNISEVNIDEISLFKIMIVIIERKNKTIFILYFMLEIFSKN
jgi:hypothetical protein